MEQEMCKNCRFAQVVWLPASETHEGIHSSDKHIDMYICHLRRAQHYGHMMQNQSCLSRQRGRIQTLFSTWKSLPRYLP